MYPTLYNLPYDKITLDPTQKGLDLKIIIYLKDKGVLYYKFKPQADPNLREKYFKCFTFDLSEVPGKINKVQVKMKIKGWHEESVEVATYLHLPGLFRGARRYAIINEKIMNMYYKKIVDDVEISQLRSTARNPCDTSIHEYDLLLIQDILTKIGCKPYFMMETEFPGYPNCTKVEDITKLNSKLDIKNTFSTFKEYR